MHAGLQLSGSSGSITAQHKEKTESVKTLFPSYHKQKKNTGRRMYDTISVKVAVRFMVDR